MIPYKVSLDRYIMFIANMWTRGHTIFSRGDGDGAGNDSVRAAGCGFVEPLLESRHVTLRGHGY